MALTAREIAQRKKDAAADAAITKRNAAAAAAAAKPPPHINLSMPKIGPAKPSEDLAVGVVTDIATTVDGVTYASVDIAGSEFRMRVPGSVKIGVKKGASVSVRTEGNARTIVALTSALPSPTYTTNPSVERRGDTAAPPSTGSSSAISWSNTAITSFTIDDASTLTLAELNRAFATCRALLTRITGGSGAISTQLGIASGSSVTMENAIDDIYSKINSLITAVSQLRDAVGTQAADLRDIGLFE